jgi:hypothetical protein
MRLKLITTLLAASAALTSISSGVTVTVAGFANTTVGLVTLDKDGAGPELRAAVSGQAIFVSVTTALTGVSASMETLLGSTTSTMAQFNTALGSLISAGNVIEASTNPGIIAGASRTFTNGAISPATVTGRQGGSAGNFTYLFLVAEEAGFITGIGAYTGPSIPSLAGTLTFNPTNANDGLGVGTSILAAATTGPVQPISGFQLAPVNAIPEPSTMLLGALGALGLLRRRR